MVYMIARSYCWFRTQLDIYVSPYDYLIMTFYCNFCCWNDFLLDWVLSISICFLLIYLFTLNTISIEIVLLIIGSEKLIWEEKL